MSAPHRDDLFRPIQYSFTPTTYTAFAVVKNIVFFKKPQVFAENTVPAHIYPGHP